LSPFQFLILLDISAVAKAATLALMKQYALDYGAKALLLPSPLLSFSLDFLSISLTFISSLNCYMIIAARFSFRPLFYLLSR